MRRFNTYRVKIEYTYQKKSPHNLEEVLAYMYDVVVCARTSKIAVRFATDLMGGSWAEYYKFTPFLINSTEETKICRENGISPFNTDPFWY